MTRPGLVVALDASVLKLSLLHAAVCGAFFASMDTR